MFPTTKFGSVILQNTSNPMKNKKLSVLKNAGENCLTYYVGDNIDHVKHLNNCTLLCNENFKPNLLTVEIINVENPQLEFYKLSHVAEDEYSFSNIFFKYKKGSNCNISKYSIIGKDVIIGNNVSIGPGTVIYSKSVIGDNVIIDSNCTIGSSGMMWVWEKNKKVFLKQLGGVKIADSCVIGSNSVIVRGSANECTEISYGVNISPGCLLGHGSFIGENTHLANGVKFGGGSSVAEYNFLGSGSIVSPGVRISCSDVIIGSGSTVTRDINEPGVYVGTPSKKVKETMGKHSGVPKWRNI
jgi:UDP-3-O-[3-hydroxymyristoyl] glucosamine N-acyltransferase